MSAEISNHSDDGFNLAVTAPTDRVREYAICKAIWFSDAMGIQRISLSDPDYGQPDTSPAVGGPVPEDWVALETAVYFNHALNPTENPEIQVADYVRECRQGFDWYR